MATKAPTDPLQGLTIDQIDVSDPESRAFLSQHVDFDDKETSKYFKDNPVKGSRGIGERFADEFVGATATGFPGLVARKAYDWFNINKPEGISEEQHDKAIADSQRAIIKEAEDKARLDPTWRPEEDWVDNMLSGRWLGTVGGMGAGSAGPEMLIAPGSSAGARIAAQGAISTGADLGYQGLEYADDVRDDISLAQAGASGLFGAGIQGVGEGVGKLVGKGIEGRLPAEQEALREDLFRTGTVDDIMANAPDAKTLDRDAVAKFVAERDRTGTADVRTRYAEPTGPMPTKQGELDLQGGDHQPELDFTVPTEPAPVGKRRGPDGKFAREPQQLEMELPEGRPAEMQRELDFNQTAPEPKVVEPKALDNVDTIVSHANDLTKDWSNAPDIEVHPHFDDVEGLGASALGLYDPESGRVHLNAKSIEAEAQLRGLTPKEMTNTVIFHEGLGHFGLAQKFRDDLDGTLEGWYEKSPYFKKKVDTWLKKNDGVYPDSENLIARAGEEILAEMSEGGIIPPKLSDTIKNKIKEIARDFGFKWDMSDRELKTILAQAHDAVVNGKGADVTGNGFRTMLGTNTKAVEDAVNAVAEEFKIKDVNKALKENDFRAQVKMQLEKNGFSQELLDKQVPRPMKAGRSEASSNPDRFKIMDDTFVSTRKEGAGTFLNELGVFNPGEIRKMSVEEAVKAAERLGIDKTWVDYFNDRRLGLKTPQPDMNKYLPSLSSKRPMKRTLGDSEGTLQGKAGKEGSKETATINKVRSNRNIDEILNEAKATKEAQSWDEWIDDAGKIKMTGKVASNLSKGTEVPELKAAELFATKQANLIFDLSKKASKGTLSYDDGVRLASAQKLLINVSESIQEVVTNAARIMNSRKIEVGSDKANAARIARLMQSYDLTTPEGSKAFAEAVTKDIKQQERLMKLNEAYTNIVNLPRSLMSSMDLSAPFRQGIFLVGKKAFWKNLPDMFKQFTSQKAFDDLMRGIENHPNHNLMKKSNLALMDMGTNLSKREEEFISNWAEKIPVMGPFVKASNRGYTGFLNKIRADVFNELVDKSKKAGIDFDLNPKALKDISKYINNATGRGNLPGKWETAAPVLAGVLFSPRLMAARVNMLNPYFYVRLSPVVRKEALKSLAAFGSIATIVTGLAAYGGADVETDPRSSDFAKVKVGDTRYDLLGGFGQYLTLGARIFTNSIKDGKGEVKELGEGYKASTSLDVLAKFFRNKASPIASYIVDWLDGKDVIGQPFDKVKGALTRFVPMFLADTVSMTSKYGPEGAIKAAPGMFGISVQDYKSQEGYDRLGNSFKDGIDENDPIAKEISRLEKATDSKILPTAPSYFKDEGQKVELSEDAKVEWQRVMGYYTKQYLSEDMKTDEYKNGDDSDKEEIIKKAHKDAYQDTKDYMIEDYLKKG